jgi:hypothetical protein
MSRPGFKRLTPFSPTQLSGCQLWLDGSDPAGTGIAPANGATVSTWKDKSTANNSVTLTSSTYSLNSTTGRYGIYFNSNPSSAVTLTPYMSFFVSSYANINFTSSFPGVFGTGVTSGYVFMFGYNGGGGNFMGAGGGIGGYATNTFGNFSSDARNMVVSESFCTPPNSFNMKIGAGDYNGNFWLGHIYEVIVYNAALTQLQYQNVEAYLAQKWGMKSFFPQSHVANTAVIYPSPRRTAPAALQLPYYNSFSLSSITSASLALWLDAADATTITGTSPITAWTDKSGLARPVTIVSGPTYGSTTRNGLNTLSFNNNTITSSIASAVGTGDFVLVAVWYQSSAGTNTVLSLGTSASSSQSLGFSGNKYNFYQYESLESAYSSTPSFVIQIGTRQSSVKAVYVNGTVGTTPASDSYNQTVTTVTIGKGDAFAITGEVAEIIVWTGTMNSTDRQLLESYLAQKWGLQSSLPSTHSNRTTPAGLPPITKQVYGQVHQAIYKKPTFLYTQNFSYTGATTTFTVPSGISPATLTVTMRGGGGGGGEYNSGGSGGLLVCIVPTTGGTTYTLTVAGGGVGTSIGGSGGAGGFGGGGKGGNGTVNNPTVPGSGGGGGTYMHSGATLIMACGGGGGNMYNNGSVSGNGGGQTGGSGTNPGYGGSQSAGGLGWTGTGDGNGSYLQGGTGAASYNGAGGGGGYYGGGAGVGGGGGSDYTTGLTVTTQTQGGASNGGATGTTGGNGSITITYYA